MNLVRAWSTLAGLSFRRLLWSTSTLMVLLPLAGCLLFVLRRHNDRPFSVNEFRDFSEFMILVFASFVVPICALAFGTASLGGDREDRTLVFLLVRPIPRALIVLAKFTATLPLVLGLVVGSYWLYWRLAGDVGQLAFSLYLADMF
jgi:ABC-type transport system involved in multi-copper enzyme maturation permease subunit